VHHGTGFSKGDIPFIRNDIACVYPSNVKCLCELSCLQIESYQNQVPNGLLAEVKAHRGMAKYVFS
jgi:hypothetical protein